MTSRKGVVALLLVLGFMGPILAEESINLEEGSPTIHLWRSSPAAHQHIWISGLSEGYLLGVFNGASSFLKELPFDSDEKLFSEDEIGEMARGLANMSNFRFCSDGKTSEQLAAQFNIWVEEHPEHWGNFVRTEFILSVTNEKNCPELYR